MGTVAYLTDVEGMWDKIRTFTDGNPHVFLRDDRLELAPGVTFVFGGDAIDRGPHGRRVVRLLLDARRRYADRVVLLAGNRDINKMRLVRELAGHPPRKAPEELRVAPRPALLRWIFENTMGAKGAFAFRKEELGDVSDEDVVESYLTDLRPGGGELAAYFAACQLAFIDGVTLYVHGGVDEESLGVTPGFPRAPDVQTWAADLNTFYRRQTEAFLADPDDPRGYAELVAYQAPLSGLKTNPASVVYGRTTDDLNNPRLPRGKVIESLAASGVRRVVVGHTPNGCSPSILRDGDFELVFADNSYARHPAAPQVTLTDELLSVDGRAILDDKRDVPVTVRLRPGDGSPVGRRVAEGGHLVKGEIPGGYLLFRCHPSYRVEQLASDLAGASLVRPD
jgi:hypothetical protein